MRIQSTNKSFYELGKLFESRAISPFDLKTYDEPNFVKTNNVLYGAET